MTLPSTPGADLPNGGNESGRSAAEIAASLERWLVDHAAAEAGQRAANRPKLRELILEGLQMDYVSESCKDGIQTGNHYQSVIVGDRATSGFRGSREAILDLVDFRDRSVLDLGSNLGEISRGARLRGASTVVGLEYEPLFVALARAINAYNGIDGVEFRAADITSWQAAHSYDIVIAFSVFTYIRRNLDEIARATRHLLILETHKLDGNMERDYVAPLTPYFPFHQRLGGSDWRASEDAERRGVVAFAKDPETLDRFVAPQALPGVAVERGGEEETEDTIDVKRTCLSLQDRFFSNFSFANSEELLAAVGGVSIDPATMRFNRDVRRGYGGWLYWLMYVKGFLEYEQTRSPNQDNVYYDYLVNHHLALGGGYAVESGSELDMAQTVERRFRDMRYMRERVRERRSEECAVRPVRVIVGEPGSYRPLEVHVVGARRPLEARLIDGWHRLFAAGLFGVKTLPCVVVPDRSEALLGSIEQVDWVGDRLEVAGWCLDPHVEFDWIELRIDGQTLATDHPRERPELAERCPDVPHAARSGFLMSADVQRPAASEPLELRVVPVKNWRALGRLTAVVSPPT